MTKRLYIHITYIQQNKSYNANYNALLLAKTCYPNLTISEILAEVKFQSLGKHTVRRLLFVNEVLEYIIDSDSTIKRINIISNEVVMMERDKRTKPL